MYKHKDFISTKDLTLEEIDFIITSSEAFLEIGKREIKKVPTLKGRTVVNLFFENSTRTRTSFEIAGKRLGADVINISGSTSSTVKGETLLDTVRNIEAMSADIITVRDSHSGSVKFLADNVETSIINAGDGQNEHPTQAMLDLLTIKQHKKSLNGLNVSIVGDIEHSRVARSNIHLMKKFGMNIKVFGPPTVIPKNVTVLGVTVAHNIVDAVKDADVIIVLRIQKERMGKLLIPSNREYCQIFSITPDIMKNAKNDVMILHPGPINRGIEISSVVADSNRSFILDQVEAGVAVRMAMLSILAFNRSGEL